MLEIKVLGPGCTNCSKLEQITRKAVSEMGFEADIDKITDYGEIMSYPILSTPGLVINDKTVSSGRVPSPGEVTSFITSALTSS